VATRTLAVALAERWYARLSKLLNHTFKERQPIVLYGSHAQFVQTNVIPLFLADGIGGVTEHEWGRVVLPFTVGLGETDHVLGHELVHAFQRDILRLNGRAISTLPLWFVEGMAEYLSVGTVDSNTQMWLRDAVEQNGLPRIDQLNDPRWFPYRYGQALWAYLADRFGSDVATRCLNSKAGGALRRLATVTGLDDRTLSSDWQEWICTLIAQPSTHAAEPATRSITLSGAEASRLNVGPAMSPDGTSIVFLTQHDQYSLDVVLADASTGAIRRRLVRTAGSAHFESLQFIESAGAWDSSGSRFALAALSRGLPVITLLNTVTGAIEREIPIREVDQAFNPTWSPDDRRIASERLQRSLCPGARDLVGAVPDGRSFRGSSACLVSGRADHCLFDRSFFFVHRDVDVRRVPSWCDRRGIRSDLRAAERSWRQEHRPALEWRRSEPVFRCRRRQRQQRVWREPS
jgi:hypothetical protein